MVTVLGDRAHDCYYLVYIGTRERCRRQGLARKLIEHMARKADAEGKAMYLESSSPDNMRLYESLGFRYDRTIGLTRAEQTVEMDIMASDALRCRYAERLTRYRCESRVPWLHLLSQKDLDPLKRDRKAQVSEYRHSAILAASLVCCIHC